MKIVYKRGPYRMRFGDKVAFVWWAFLCFWCTVSAFTAQSATNMVINGAAAVFDLYFALDSLKFYEAEGERMIVPDETEDNV